MGNATPDPVYNLETAPNSFPSWQFIPPNSGPLPSNTKVITTNHTGEATDDLVKELRAFGANGYMLRAADEIERLMKELVSITYRLTAERDEARRELCAARRELCRDEAFIRLQRHRVHRDSEDVVGLAKEIAVERGWDCFKDNTDG